jgi:hypothetical protein
MMMILMMMMIVLFDGIEYGIMLMVMMATMNRKL